MLAMERRNVIIQLLQEKGYVTVAEMSQKLGVSEMTIRRDLKFCEETQQFVRCHGGAMRPDATVQEIDYNQKLESNIKMKQRIAKACVAKLRPGMNVYLDAGTTTLCIAEAMMELEDLTVVTNDLKIALCLSQGKAKVTVLGGLLQKRTGCLLGPSAMEALKQMRFDIGFVGAASIDSAFNSMSPTLEKAYIKRTVREICRECYLATDASKFNSQALYCIHSLNVYDAVVTDATFTPKEIQTLNALGVTIEPPAGA